MKFSTVVGQNTLKTNIVHLIHEQKLPHAIMLLGTEGSGGLPLALAMAQYIQCTNKTETDSCGVCPSCSMIEKLQHPDVHFSFPTIKKDTKIPVSNDFIVEFREFIQQNAYANDIEWLNFLGTEKQGNITALECREIIQKLTLRTFMSKFKVLIMWCPEYLGSEGNILLKQIEEPTPNTIIIFVATSLDKVLATIQSRTQLFNLAKLKTNDIQQALIEKNIESSKALMIANIADGNYNYALQLIQHHDDDLIARLKAWLNAMYGNKGLEIVSWSNEMASLNKETQKKFLQYTVQLFEQLIRYQLIGKNHIALLEEEYRMLDIFIAKKVNDGAIAKITQKIETSIYELERNANAKILFHSLSLHIQQMLLAKKAVA